MYEKILQKLKDQRGQTSNVSDRSLEDLAKSLETIITTDEILAVANLTKAIESIDGNINHYTAEAVKKAKDEDDAEKARKVEEEKVRKATEAKKKKDEKAGIKTEEPPEWLQSMTANMEKISTDLLALKNEKVTSTRSDQLNKIVKDLPDYVANTFKESFKTASFENDEAFSTYLQQVEKSGKTFEQAAKEQGLNTNTPTVVVQKPIDTGETTEIAEARKLVNKNKEKNATNTNDK